MALGAPLQRPGDSPIRESRQMCARRVLAQHPVPVIAVADDGAVLFANTAFADVPSCLFSAVTRLGADAIASLLQLGQATLFVRMRRSAIVPGADSGAITLFEALMERLSRLAEPRGSPL
jgi:hypothetical protein